MGKRGPVNQFDHVMWIHVTDAHLNAIEAYRALYGGTKAAVVRAALDAFLSRPQGSA